jgi:hypothetical protein
LIPVFIWQATSWEYRLAASAVSSRKFSSLNDIITEYFVDLASLVVEGPPGEATHSLFSGAKCLKVFTGERAQILKELESESACKFTLNLDI